MEQNTVKMSYFSQRTLINHITTKGKAMKNVIDFEQRIYPTEDNCIYSIRIDKEEKPFQEVHQIFEPELNRDGWIITIVARTYSEMEELRLKALEDLKKELPISV